MAKLTDYNKTNFAELVEKRKEGVTEETFMEDVVLYTEAINSLPPYNEEDLRSNIRQMEFDIPIDEYEFNKLQSVYSRLVSYRFSIVEMHSVVNAHHDMFEKAYKSLFKSALMLMQGTAKDKESYAENRVQPFAIGVLNTDSFLKYLSEIKEAVEFASTNMARMLREREALANINMRHVNEGAMTEFKNSHYNNSIEILDKAREVTQSTTNEDGVIKTRKKLM